MRCRGTLYREAVPAAAVIDDAGTELAGLLSQLVAFPTESTTPNIELIRWVADHIESNGGRVTILDGAEGRANLLASFGPKRTGGLMLSGHTDVVPAGIRLGQRALFDEPRSAIRCTAAAPRT